MIDRILHITISYIELGIEFIAKYLMTLEGIVGIVFGLFLLSLIARIRSL